MTVVPAATNNLEQSLFEDVETYIHRVGRTARAGRAGTAITFVGQYDIEMFDQLRREFGETLKRHPLNLYEAVRPSSFDHDSGNGRARRASSYAISP